MNNFNEEDSVDNIESARMLLNASQMFGMEHVFQERREEYRESKKFWSVWPKPLCANDRNLLKNY